jgi:hypothetical protein
MATPSEALQKKRELLEKSLVDSPTAYARETAPTSKDLSASTELSSIKRQIESIRSQQIRDRWYGGEETEQPDPSQGSFMRAITALQRPMNAIMGAGQYGLGKGSESGLVANINEAMKKGLTAGNILKQYGAPRSVQVPLGFALDVMFDPINWATVGTAALIPRIGMGLVKGGAKGAATGLTTGVTRKAATAMRFMPFVKTAARIAPEVEAAGKATGLRGATLKGAQRYSTAAEKMGIRAIKGTEKYDKLVGKDVYDRLGKGVVVLPTSLRVMDAVEGVTRGQKKLPGLSFLGKAVEESKSMYPGQTMGDKLTDFFKYSPQEMSKMSNQMDDIKNLYRKDGAVLVRSQKVADFIDYDDFRSPGATIREVDKAGKIINVAIRDADGVIKPNLAGKIKIHDSKANALKILEKAGKDYNPQYLTRSYRETPLGKTGVLWYDNLIDKFKNTTLKNLKNRRLGPIILDEIEKDADDLVKAWNSYDKVINLKPFNKMLETQEALLAIFKSAKVPMNVSSHVVALIGNFFMGGMMGLPVYNAQYLKSMTRASLLVKGRLSISGFREMFMGDLDNRVDTLINMADNNPTRFKQLTGLDPREIARKISTEQKITHAISSSSSKAELKKITREAAVIIGREVDETIRLERIISAKGLSKLDDTLESAIKAESKSNVNKQLFRQGVGRPQTPYENLKEMLEEAPVRRVEEVGSMTTAELAPNRILGVAKERLAIRAANKPYDPISRLADGLFNTMPRWYEHIDQTFKISTSNYLTKIGLTESQLLKVARTVSVTKDDLLEPIIKGGQKYYRFSQLKAADVATEAYMNYSAMPDFIRVMRAVPVAGSPFFSFPYAMAIKTGKTAIDNPALFNKVGFLINEMNASRTPEEKYALEEKYNQYLKEPSVVKMFGMWNTNVKNYVPYYTLNMFQPSQRGYGDSSAGRVLKMTDKLPLFQDPAGGVLRDYFIQPWILSNFGEGEAPQGQFGQPLFPSYDEEGKRVEPSLGTKSLHAGKTLAEALVPGSLSYLGLAGRFLPQGVIDNVPSYGFRNLANATKGQSVLGAKTKENAVQKTFRSLMGRTGLPLYTLDTTKLQIKK